MVQGNWQRRVEKTDARRVAAKQRKQRESNRGTYKVMVHEFLALLDRHGDALRQRTCECVLHIWTDSIPSDSSPLLDIYEQQEQYKRNGKGRSDSFNNEKESSVRNGRGRSNSMNDPRAVHAYGKKKKHPRTGFKDNVSDPSEAEDVTAPRLCQNHFFTGKCEHRGRRSGCRHVHCSKRQETLRTVLSNKNDTNSSYDWEEHLSISAEAASEVTFDAAGDVEISDGSMDMIYHFPVHLFRKEFSDDEQKVKVSEIVSKALSEKSCNIGSIVYVAINSTLMFDRYRDGLVITEGALMGTVLGNRERQTRSGSVESKQGVEIENVGEAHLHQAALLPGSILEHILIFLPDTAVSTMSTVCQAWYNEIGQHSPGLWRHLLQRRNWPISSSVSNVALIDMVGGDANNTRNALRNIFLTHYAAVRDVRAIKFAMSTVMGKSRNFHEKDVVFQSFPTRRGAPQEPNVCSAVKIWSPRQILVAYKQDCTLRLFQAVEKPVSDSGSAPRGCREVVCLRAAPFLNTKKRTCELVAMDVDDENIGCLCHVIAGNEIVKYMLTVLKREDFLCAGGAVAGDAMDFSASVDGSAPIIDVGEAMLNYVFSQDVFDPHLLPLYDLVASGDRSKIHVVSSRNVVACGCGLFMLEVSIWVPIIDVGAEAFLNTETVLLDRKLILISAPAEAIVWMGDNTVTQIQHNLDDVQMAIYRKPHEASGRMACSVTIASSRSPSLLSVNVDPTGHISVAKPIKAAELVRNKVLRDNWEINQNDQNIRPITMTLSDIVAVDNLTRVDWRISFKSVISFYPRNCTTTDTAYSILKLEFECETLQVEALRDDHLLLICRVFTFEKEEELEQFDANIHRHEQIDAVVIHVPTRTVIHRACLFNEVDLYTAVSESILFAAKGNTVGAGVFWKGVILTGQDVRSVGENYLMKDAANTENRSAKKKKKKRLRIVKSNKKDEFARGMSLRG